jgi:hypothetical protein
MQIFLVFVDFHVDKIHFAVSAQLKFWDVQVMPNSAP